MAHEGQEVLGILATGPVDNFTVHIEVSDSETSVNDIVNCFCGTTYDDGTEMLQCEICSEWSHCACYNLSEFAASQIDFECNTCKSDLLYSFPRFTQALVLFLRLLLVHCRILVPR